jgi:hypothetical protein
VSDVIGILIVSDRSSTDMLVCVPSTIAPPSWVCAGSLVHMPCHNAAAQGVLLGHLVMCVPCMAAVMSQASWSCVYCV